MKNRTPMEVFRLTVRLDAEGRPLRQEHESLDLEVVVLHGSDGGPAWLDKQDARKE